MSEDFTAPDSSTPARVALPGTRSGRNLRLPLAVPVRPRYHSEAPDPMRPAPTAGDGQKGGTHVRGSQDVSASAPRPEEVAATSEPGACACGTKKPSKGSPSS